MPAEWIWWLNGLAAFVTATAGFFRNRNPIAWFVIGATFPLIGLVLLFILEPLGPDGTPERRCCQHCPHLHKTEEA